MKGGFSELLRRFCVDGTVVGLKYFYLYPDIISRCFWAINMSAVFLLAWVLTWLLYHRFQEMPTRITIENQYEPIQNLPHPAIAICSPNQVTISAMKHFNRTLVDGNTTIDLQASLPQLLGFYERIASYNNEDLEHLQHLIEINRYTVIEVLSALPISCERFLQRCFFDEKIYSCSDLFKPILTKHGLCCIFNGLYNIENKKRNERDPNFVNRMIFSSGLTSSLTVVTDFDPDDAIDGTILNAGAIRVMLNDWTEFPSDDESTMVQAHSESYHILDATYTYCSEDVIQLPGSSRKCYFEDEHQLRYFWKYRNSDCDQLCFVKAVEETCHCLLYYLPNVRIERACNVTSVTCIFGVKLHMSKWMLKNECDCPRDCESRRYHAHLAVGNLDGLDTLTSNIFRGIKFNKSTSIMHFFFPNSVYVKKKQETVISMISLVSNLGGVFGLCLGCSGISVLEILFYFYNWIRNRIRRCCRK